MKNKKMNLKRTAKVIFAILTAILLASIVGCDNQDMVLDEAKTYDVTSEIHSMDIRISAADFKIQYGEKFTVVSNLKNLKVSEANGALSLTELSENSDKFFKKKDYRDAMLTIYIPEGTVFKNVSLSSGAGKFTVDTISAETLDFEFGAGDVYINTLVATKYAALNGGTGRITVSGGALNNFDLKMGTGELNLKSRLSGACEFEMGVGEAKITLIGSMDDYKLDVTKGVGEIFVDGVKVTDFGSSGNSANRVKISGGVGKINVNFEGTE